MEMNNVNVIDIIKGITDSGLPLMEGKEKLETSAILNTVVNVNEFDFMDGELGEYVVFTTKEYPDNFFYGSSVTTESFKKLVEKVEEKTLQGVLEFGLPCKFTELMSKNKRKYIRVIFYPNN